MSAPQTSQKPTSFRDIFFPKKEEPKTAQPEKTVQVTVPNCECMSTFKLEGFDKEIEGVIAGAKKKIDAEKPKTQAQAHYTKEGKVLLPEVKNGEHIRLNQPILNLEEILKNTKQAPVGCFIRHEQVLRLRPMDRE